MAKKEQDKFIEAHSLGTAVSLIQQEADKVFALKTYITSFVEIMGDKATPEMLKDFSLKAYDLAKKLL